MSSARNDLTNVPRTPVRTTAKAFRAWPARRNRASRSNVPNTRLKCEYASERAIVSCTPASRSFSVFSASSVADLARRQRSQEHPSPLAIVGLGLSRCAPLDAILRSQFAGEGGQRLADRVARRARRLVGRGGELPPRGETWMSCSSRVLRAQSMSMFEETQSGTLGLSRVVMV